MVKFARFLKREDNQENKQFRGGEKMQKNPVTGQSNQEEPRKELWSELISLKSSHQALWCIGGDFNEIRCINETVGCSRLDRGMKDFQEFTDNIELIDIPIVGRLYTWTNFQDNAIHSRLDRFLISLEWEKNLRLFNGDYKGQFLITAL